METGGYAKNLTNDDKSKRIIIIMILSTWKKSVEVRSKTYIQETS